MNSRRWDWPGAHRQNKQSAPSKLNMALWEAPVIWGLKEETRDEGSLRNDGKHVETDSFTSDGVLALWGCIPCTVDVASGWLKWHYFHITFEGPPGADSPLTAFLCTIAVWLKPFWYGIKGRWHKQCITSKTNIGQRLQLNIHDSQGLNVQFQSSSGDVIVAYCRGKCPRRS